MYSGRVQVQKYKSAKIYDFYRESVERVSFHIEQSSI